MPNDPKINKKIEEVESQPAIKTPELPNIDILTEKIREPKIGQEQRGAVLTEIKNEEIEIQAGPEKFQPFPVVDERRIKDIECILEEGLKNIYIGLPVDKKVEFKKTGEQIAGEINKIISQDIKGVFWKIIILIKRWLSIIPGVKSYFLEQEAKIKTERILEEFHLKKSSS